MNEPAIILRLDGNGRTYWPGETLSGEYRVESVASEELSAIELSVLWYTEGKGEEDMAVHEFWRHDAANGDWIGLRRPERFSTTLPSSPLSYDGEIVKIRWCVRVRAFLTRGKELVQQKVFRLGSVPPVITGRRTTVAARPAEKAALAEGEDLEDDARQGPGKGESPSGLDRSPAETASYLLHPGEVRPRSELRPVGDPAETSPTRVVP